MKITIIIKENRKSLFLLYIDIIYIYYVTNILMLADNVELEKYNIGIVQLIYKVEVYVYNILELN